MCIRCDNPNDDLKMNFWREITLCKQHKKEWKEYKAKNKEKIRFIEKQFDRLLNAIDEEIQSRKQIGKK